MSTMRRAATEGKTATGGLHATCTSTHSDEVADGAAPQSSYCQDIRDVDQLDNALSEPSEELVEVLSSLDGDFMILGAGGKMGPSLARMIRRATDLCGRARRVIGVSRYSNPETATKLRGYGIDAVVGDLLDAAFVRSLPRAENVLYLAGMKFGAANDAAQTWVSNTYLAGLVADHFRGSRLAVLSSGNIYGLLPVDAGQGSVETDLPVPVGEYAMSVLGRERVFEYFSQTYRIPTVVIRLNYAAELRYGVLVDLARKVYRGDPIPLHMGFFNAIWQRDACDVIVRSLQYASSPPLTVNVTGVDRLSCRSVCERLGEILDRPVKFAGAESPTALLSDASLCVSLFGLPRTSIDEMVKSTADWIASGGETWNKPTQFEVRDGKY